MTSDVRRSRRRQLVEKLAADGIGEPPVLRAIGAVPRHLFVPPRLVDEAYLDCPLPIGEGQTISQPYVVAFMRGALRVGPGAAGACTSGSATGARGGRRRPRSTRS